MKQLLIGILLILAMLPSGSVQQSEAEPDPWWDYYNTFDNEEDFIAFRNEWIGLFAIYGVSGIYDSEYQAIKLNGYDTLGIYRDDMIVHRFEMGLRFDVLFPSEGISNISFGPGDHIYYHTNPMPGYVADIHIVNETGSMRVRHPSRNNIYHSLNFSIYDTLIVGFTISDEGHIRYTLNGNTLYGQHLWYWSGGAIEAIRLTTSEDDYPNYIVIDYVKTSWYNASDQRFVPDSITNDPVQSQQPPSKYQGHQEPDDDYNVSDTTVMIISVVSIVIILGIWIITSIDGSSTKKESTPPPYTVMKSNPNCCAEERELGNLYCNTCGRITDPKRRTDEE